MNKWDLKIIVIAALITAFLVGIEVFWWLTSSGVSRLLKNSI